MLDRLYELGLSGSVSAMSAYLQHTKAAQTRANAGRKEETGTDLFNPADAALLSDEELDRLSGQAT